MCLVPPLRPPADPTTGGNLDDLCIINQDSDIYNLLSCNLLLRHGSTVQHPLRIFKIRLTLATNTPTSPSALSGAA
jgi:hypothetical protein